MLDKKEIEFMPEYQYSAKEMQKTRPVVLILDRNTPGRRRLCYHLKRQIDAPYIVESCDLLEQADAGQIAPIIDRTAVCLFTLTQTRALEHHVWPDSTSFFLLSDENDKNAVDRYQPVSTISKQILPEGADNRYIECSAAEAKIDLVLSFDRESRDRWLSDLLEARIEDGGETYFLPLMPIFLVPDLEIQKTGETLSDFLLALDADPKTDVNALGRCFFRHSKGYLTPRLPERSDDLITAEPSLLLALLKKLRERISLSGEGTLGIVVCDGLPLSTVAELAGAADRLWIDPSGGASSSSTLARREIGILLADIPSSCRVYEIRLKETSA